MVLLVASMSLVFEVVLADPPAGQQVNKALAAASADPNTYEAVTKLQAASAIMDARVNLAQKQKELVEDEKAIRDAGGDADSADGSASPGDVPMVMRIEGAHGVMSAVILMPSGGLLEARPGDTVGSSGKIVEITASGVRVEHKGVVHSLSFAVPRSTMEQVSDRAQSLGAQLPGSGRSMTLPPVPLSPPTRSQQ
jgi:type IV pilus biogenesis protein PilP